MIKSYKPTSAGIRFRKTLVKDVDNVSPEKSLTKPIKGPSGRNRGLISIRHRQRGAKKLYRVIDFKRDKINVPGKVLYIEHDPNRGPSIALVVYADGEKRYILAPEGLQRGDIIISGSKLEPKVGNCMPLKDIPLGREIHNIEINPGAGGVLIRGAGNSAQILAKEGNYANVRLSSGEVKKILLECFATIGALGNGDLRNAQAGKAGRKRHLGIRPTVRGVKMADPKNDHPHAGSYGHTGIGLSHPKTPWGKNAYGVRTRKRTRTSFTIVKSRHERKRR